MDLYPPVYRVSFEAITFSDTTVRVYGKTPLVKGKVDIVNNTDSKWQMVARQATRLP
jgi:hypothetical protein